MNWNGKGVILYHVCIIHIIIFLESFILIWQSRTYQAAPHPGVNHAHLSSECLLCKLFVVLCCSVCCVNFCSNHLCLFPVNYFFLEDKSQENPLHTPPLPLTEIKGEIYLVIQQTYTKDSSHYYSHMPPQNKVECWQESPQFEFLMLVSQLFSCTYNFGVILK